MKIDKVKISGLPLIERLRGFFTLGVGPDGKSYKADLGFVEDAADAAENAAASASIATSGANAAANSANAAAQRAEDSVLDLGIVKDQVNENTSDIDGLRQQIEQEAHFRGYVRTRAELNAISDVSVNDYAYLVEIVAPSTTSNKWIYNGSAWIDSGASVPDQMVPKSNSTPLVDGTATVGTENAYAAGDHRHPVDTSRAAKNYVDDELAKKQDTLIAGANITIDPGTKIISASSGINSIVQITDYDTFTPWSGLTDLTTGKPFTLAAGEYCGCVSWGASGRPPTVRNVAVWSGILMRLDTNNYRVFVMPANTNLDTPHLCTKMYSALGVIGPWFMAADNALENVVLDKLLEENGYMKLPDGLMIQWGKHSTGSTSNQVTVYFPMIFGSVYSVVATSNQAESVSTNLYSVWVPSLTTSYFTYIRRGISTSGAWVGNNPIFWIAVGRWK